MLSACVFCCVWHSDLFHMHVILLYSMWVLDNCQVVISLYVFVFDTLNCVICFSYYCTQSEYCNSQTVISLFVVVCDILICVVRISYYWTQCEYCYIQTFISLVVVVHDRVICFVYNCQAVISLYVVVYDTVICVVCISYYCTLCEY